MIQLIYKTFNKSCNHTKSLNLRRTCKPKGFVSIKYVTYDLENKDPSVAFGEEIVIVKLKIFEISFFSDIFQKFLQDQ